MTNEEKVIEAIRAVEEINRIAFEDDFSLEGHIASIEVFSINPELSMKIHFSTEELSYNHLCNICPDSASFGKCFNSTTCKKVESNFGKYVFSTIKDKILEHTTIIEKLAKRLEER